MLASLDRRTAMRTGARRRLEVIESAVMMKQTSGTSNVDEEAEKIHIITFFRVRRLGGKKKKKINSLSAL